MKIGVFDSAEATAAQAAAALGTIAKGEAEAQRTFFATDSVEKFQRLGTRFLGEPIEQVQLIDLGG